MHETSQKRIAVYGGSFDPVHNGHMAIARELIDQFHLDRMLLVPAFHAPHKPDRVPTSPFHRFAMLCLATAAESRIFVSRVEIEQPERPFTVQTLSRLGDEMPDAEIFFVMGADSWQDIRTWRDWERLLVMTNHIVVTRPGYEIDSGHVTREIRSRITDLKGGRGQFVPAGGDTQIFLTDRVDMNVSSSDVRENIRENKLDWRADLPAEVANYIEKYQIYK